MFEKKGLHLSFGGEWYIDVSCNVFVLAKK